MLNKSLARPVRRQTLISPSVVLLAGLVVALPTVHGQENVASVEQSVEGDKEPDEGRFSFRLVDVQGVAVPGQEVRFQIRPRPIQMDVAPGEHLREDRTGFYAKTDQQGRIGFDLGDRANFLSIRIKAPKLGPYMAEWDRSKTGDEIPLEFKAEVERAWKVGGIVVDELGEPIAGVEVDPSIRYRKPSKKMRATGLGTRIFTDELGVWEFSMVPDSMADVHVEVSHRDYKPHRQRLARDVFGLTGGAVPSAKITLSSGLAISGRVTDTDGKPIEEALVRTKFLNDIRSATTDAEGRYQIRGCEPRHTKVVVSAAGKALDGVEVIVDEDMEPVDFQMKPGGHVRVRVVDKEGKGIRKARIFFQKWRDKRIDYFEFDHVNQYTDANGVWEWNEAPLDGFHADICHPTGMQMSDQELKARDEEYVFQPPLQLIVSGLVIDAETKKLIPDFRVVPGIIGSEGAHTNWVTDRAFKATNGRYRCQHLNNAYYAHLVRIDVEGYLPQVSREIRSDEGNVTLHFKLERGTDVSTVVQSASGEPVEGVTVVLGVADTQITMQNGRLDESSTYNAKHATADAEGRFVFSPQIADYQLILVHDKGYAHVKAKAADTLSPITLTPWATLTGVHKIGSEPQSGNTIIAGNNAMSEYGTETPNISWHNKAVTGRDGQFRFDRLPAGRNSVQREIIRMVREGAIEVASTPIQPIMLESGKDGRVSLGGEGVAISGKLTPPASHTDKIDWKQGSVRIQADIQTPPYPESPKDIQQDREKSRVWWAEWNASKEGKALVAKKTAARAILDRSVSYYATIDKDGSFTIADVVAGKYTMNARIDQGPSNRDFKFEISKEQVFQGDSVDLGDVQLD